MLVEPETMVSGCLSSETQSLAPEDSWVAVAHTAAGTAPMAGTGTQSSCASCLHTSVPVVPEVQHKVIAKLYYSLF